MLNLTVLVSVFLIGLVGGTHCVFMCGPTCGAIAKNDPKSMIGLHLGRLIAYFVLGAVVAYSTSIFAALQANITILKPVWTLFHALIFAWGMILIIFARQPVWMDHLARKVWGKIYRYQTTQRSSFFIGLIWAFIPCGLLYSALAVASLSSNPLEGGLRMIAFGLATCLYLIISPTVWFKLRQKLSLRLQRVGTRFAGIILCTLSILALKTDILSNVVEWCR